MAKAKRPKVNRMTPWVCRDGTRTCAAVMSTAHIAYSLAALVREPGEVGLSFDMDPERQKFIPVFLAELNARLRKKKFGQ